jgi:hypothetical protein
MSSSFFPLTGRSFEVRISLSFGTVRALLDVRYESVEPRSSAEESRKAGDFRRKQWLLKVEPESE